jgi:Ras-related protein Rab-5C
MFDVLSPRATLTPLRPGKNVRTDQTIVNHPDGIQPGYRSLAPIYFRNSAAAVIVYDITQVRPFPSSLPSLILSLTSAQPPESSFEKAKTWVQTLQRQADPGIIIILVGNKLDLAQEDPSLRRTSREMGEQYAETEGLLFLEASAKTGENVEEIFMEIGEFHDLFV